MFNNKDIIKTLKLFVRRSAKYFMLLTFLIMMIVPIISSYYQTAKKDVLNSSIVQMNKGIVSLQSQIQQVKEIGNLLLSEKSYKNLMITQGAPEFEQYVEINTVQRKLSSLNLTRDYITDLFVLFRDNPIYISNYIAADDYHDVYPQFLNIKGQSAQEWHDKLFSNNNPLEVFPSTSLYSSYSVPQNYESVTCVISNSYFESMVRPSVIVCSFDQDYILSNMVSEEVLKKSFFYLTDISGRIILSQNYEAEQPLAFLDQQEKATINGEHYVILKSETSDLGFQAILGISESFFSQKVNHSLTLVQWYLFGGLSVILLVALFLSYREALSFKKVIDIASISSDTSYGSGKMRNEYTYINNAFQRHLNKIDHLNNLVRVCAMENLLISGAYTQAEKDEMLKLFHNSFDAFCIVVIRTDVKEKGVIDQELQRSLLLQLEENYKLRISTEFVSVNTNVNEMALIIFLDSNESCDITKLKDGLSDLMQIVQQQQSSLAFTINIGLSTLASGIEYVREAYLQAKDTVSFHANPETDGIYLYSTPRQVACQKTLDVALLIKCYDGILCGDQTVILQIFQDILKITAKGYLGDQERLQLLFSIRQPIFNAYLEISSNHNSIDPEVKPPQIDTQSSWEQILEGLKGFALFLCQQVELNKCNSRNQLKENILLSIQEHYFDVNLCAFFISEKLHISEKYVFQVVKEMTGKSLGKYIEDIRVEKAEELLQTTDFSNSKIAAMCGFGSENTFYRAFSKKHGVTPSNWRDRK